MRNVEIKVAELKDFAGDYFDSNKEGRWNGRQIRNAFQSALALAELDALGTDSGLLLDDITDHDHTVVLGRKNFETVANAYRGFVDYLKQVYGVNFGRRARENLWRYDAFGMPKVPNALTTRLRVADSGPPRGPPGCRSHKQGTGTESHNSRSRITSRSSRRHRSSTTLSVMNRRIRDHGICRRKDRILQQQHHQIGSCRHQTRTREEAKEGMRPGQSGFRKSRGSRTAAARRGSLDFPAGRLTTQDDCFLHLLQTLV
ncbi:hypothetical protein PG994_012547 [Apiospora phragmitis]|uniref:AAA+ ATPase lid domain-containing protein n=1 Tax=Apiospora phragmitis TaxID=2905665 RepID=A0ABR1TW67_9PEZI